MNRSALRNKLAQLSARIKAQERTVATLKAAGATTTYSDAERTLKRLRKEREKLIEELHE